MKPQRSFKKDQRIIVVLYIILILSLCPLLFGCRSSSSFKTKLETKDSSEFEQQSQTDKNLVKFDRSQINEQDYSLEYLPLDPTKEMSISNQGGTTKYKNVKPIWRNNNTQTNKDQTEISNENTNTQTSENTTKETTQSWFRKIVIGVPWYAYPMVVIGLGLLLFINRQSKKIKSLKSKIQ